MRDGVEEKERGASISPKTATSLAWFCAAGRTSKPVFCELNHRTTSPPIPSDAPVTIKRNAAHITHNDASRGVLSRDRSGT